MAENYVKPEEIHYISLEGGGGKGFAYLGAIDALNNIEGWDWNRIKGFSGSSAGAITAFLLSIGFTTKDQISTFMAEKIKQEAFFEPANPRYIPSPGGYIKAATIPSSLDIATAIQKIVSIFLLVDLIRTRNEYTQAKEVTINYVNKLIRDANSKLNVAKREMLHILLEIIKYSLFPVNLIVPESVWERLESLTDNIRLKPIPEIQADKERDVFEKGIDAAIKELAKSLQQLEKERDSTFLLMLHYLPQAFIYLDTDMGLFHGKKARDIFDQTIANAMGQSRTNTTFKQHFDHFGKKLVVTGSNLSTGETILFSYKETPNFPVADAIRISMSLPFIFKPYVIREAKEGYPPCGLYVDGGLFNNSPLHVFDDDVWAEQEEAKRNAFSLPLSKAIGLRLEFVTPWKLPVLDSNLNFRYPFLATTIFNAIFGTGESQVLRREKNRYIHLDSTPLSIVGFDPPKDDIVFKRSRRTVYRYFGLEPEARDRDDNDDRESEERKKKASNPCGK